MEIKKKEKTGKKEKKKERNSSIGKSSFSLREKESFKKNGSSLDSSALGGTAVVSPTIIKFPSLSRVGKTAELHLALPTSESENPKINVNIWGNYYF